MGSYLNAYSVTIIILVVGYFLLTQKRKNEIINWLYVCNSIVPWISLLYLLSYAADLFIAWYGQNPYEWYGFSQNEKNIWLPYGWSYWLLFSFNCLLPQLLWLKKLRKSIWFSLFMILVLSSGLWFERLVIYITSAYRDYLPSSWSTYSESEYFINLLSGMIFFIVLSAVVYWLFHKRKKLPFPSAIFPYFLFFISYSLFHCIHHFN